MSLRQQLNAITHDAILWLSLRAWKGAGTALGQEQATGEIMKLLLLIPNQVRRDAYAKAVCELINKKVSSLKAESEKQGKHISTEEKRLAKLKDATDRHELSEQIEILKAQHLQAQCAVLPELPLKELQRYLKAEAEQRSKEKKEKMKNPVFDSTGDAEEEWDENDPWAKCPTWINVQDVKEKGFSLVENRKEGKLDRTGFYTYNPVEKQHQQLTNFAITPIFHIESSEGSRHMIEIDNGYKKSILDLESKVMVSPDLMMQMCVAKGNFVVYASKLPWLRLASHLLQNFRSCLQVEKLGWQRYGFFAFVNGVYIPEVGYLPADEWGVIEFEGQHFLIPSASAVWRKSVSTEDDPFEHDRPLEYFEPHVSFDAWVAKMQEVFLEKGTVGVAYCIMCAFRDIVFGIENNFPHLYGFGEKSSGKSAWAQSVSNFFFVNRPAFPLPSGTEFAFFKYMGNFRNTVAFMNELDSKTTKPEWIQAIKGVFDGEGRQRGSMKHKGKTETMKIDCGLVLAGQYLLTDDDNSVVTRSIIEGFAVRQLSNQDRKKFDELRQMESKGLTGLLAELLSHRTYFKQEYKQHVIATMEEWRDAYTGGVTFNLRLMQNWAYLYTAMLLATRKLALPSVDIKAFKQYCFEQGSHWCKYMRSSDTLSEFWNTLMFLLESHEITMGWDIRIETHKTITIRKNREETYKKEFLEPTKILYLRLNNVHKIYEQTYRSRTGKQGMGMESLLHYFSSRPYYIGPIQNIRWSRKVSGEVKIEEKITNGYAFLYNDLDLDIETNTELMAVTKAMDTTGAEWLNQSSDVLPFGSE